MSITGFSTPDAALRETYDRVDIVVSNAASGVLKPVMEMGLKHFRWCMTLSNSFGFGGSNSCVVLRSPELVGNRL